MDDWNIFKTQLVSKYDFLSLDDDVLKKEIIQALDMKDCILRFGSILKDVIEYNFNANVIHDGLNIWVDDILINIHRSQLSHKTIIIDYSEPENYKITIENNKIIVVVNNQDYATIVNAIVLIRFVDLDNKSVHESSSRIARLYHPFNNISSLHRNKKNWMDYRDIIAELESALTIFTQIE